MKKNNTLTLYCIIGLLLVLLFLNHNENNYELTDKVVDKEEVYETIHEPKRYYDSKYHTRGRMRINVPTRGVPPSYQQVGILTDTDDPENIKPLYGRQTYRGSNQWNYFTSLDSHLATKIPIYISDKDCTDEYGCKEIYKNEVIIIGDSENKYKVTMYQTYAPRYIP